MKNKEYWLSRIRNVYDENYKRQYVRNIYSEAYSDIEKEIKNLYKIISGKGTLTTTQLYRYDRFMALLKCIDKTCGGMQKDLTSHITDTLTNAYKSTFNIANKSIGSDLTWGIQNEKMVESMLKTKWAGSNYSERIWKNTNDIAKRIESDVSVALTQGKSGRVLAKQIEKDFNVSFHAADRIVRTELAHTINQGQLDTYKSDGVRYVEWSAAIESGRTCELCKKYDGKVFETDKCPVILHPNCRCTMLPVLDIDFEKSDKEWDKWLKERNLKEDENGELIDITTGKPAEMHRRKNIPTKTIDNSAKSGIIKGNDIKIHKSLGAASFRDTILLPNGNKGKIKENSTITKVVTFAGKGTDKKLRVAKYLEEQYGVEQSEWKHLRGDGYVVCDDGITRHAELHWFECDKVGRIKMKVKRYFNHES